MRNPPTTATELWRLVLLEGLQRALRGNLAIEFPVTGQPLKLDFQGVQARLALELRLRFEPRDVESLPPPDAVVEPGATKTKVDGRLLAARFLSRRSQELLVNAGWNYADGTGNVRIALDRPPLFIQLQGADKDPFREPRPLRTLRGPAAGRLVRALADFRPPYGVIELAERAEASAAMASRVVALLEADAIVTRDRRAESGGVDGTALIMETLATQGIIPREKRGAITAVNLKALIERWCEDYSFTKSNRVVRFLAVRGRKALLENVKKSPRQYAITGALVAEERITVAPAIVTAIYSPDPDALARDCELEPAVQVADVLLAEPFDPVVFKRTWQAGGLRYVAPTQAVADLLTSGDRNPQIGAALMQWMEVNPDVWRT